MREGSPWFVVGALLLVAAWLAPGHYVPWPSFQQQAFFAAGAWVLGVAALRDRSGPLVVPSAAVGLGLLAGVPLLQHAAGLVVYRSDAILPAAYVAAVALAAIIAFRLTALAPEAFVERLFAILLAAAVGSAAIALWQWLGLPDSLWIAELPRGGRPFANVAQPNHLATLCAMGIMATAYFYEKRRVGGVAAGLLLLVLGWALVMTQSRTAWLFLALLFVWYVAYRERLGLRAPLPVVLGALLLFIGGVLCWSPLNDLLLLSSPVSVSERMTAGNLRPLHWQTLWDAILRAPWFGYGWNQVAIAQQAAALDHPASGEWLQQSHNHALDLLVYNGLPLGALVLGGMAWWLTRHVRACRSPEQWALLGALGAMLIHAAFEYPFDYLYFALTAGLAVGALSALGPSWTGRFIAPAWVLALLLTLSGGMLSWLTWEYLQVESGARQLRFVSMRIGLDKVPDAPVPEVWLLDQPRQFHRLLLTPARRNMSTEELDEFQRVMKRQPTPPVMLRYAIAAGLNGRPEEAARTLAVLCRIHQPVRCDEGRDAWRTAGSQYPELKLVAYPEGTAPRRGIGQGRGAGELARVPMQPMDR